MVKATLVFEHEDPDESDVLGANDPHDPKVLQHLRHLHAKHLQSPQWIKLMKTGKNQAMKSWTVCGRPVGRLEP